MSTPARRQAQVDPWQDPNAEPILRIEGVTKTFGKTYAVDDVSLDIFRGEFFALLGGSGCGKSTLLRILGGFEVPDKGRVLIDGTDMTHVPPYERPVNMMFQSYALFPHMTVEQNIAFGLKQDKRPASEIGDRVAAMLDLVKMGQLGRRKPDQLSGGQRQRVALARALAKAPKLLLLDEPLGALDKKLREHTQFELVNIQERTGTTFVMVTHDQEEAMTMSTRVAVMDAGRIVQVSTPSNLYEYPNSKFVAEFIGAVNMLRGTVVDQQDERVLVHCHDVELDVWARYVEPIPMGTDVNVAIRPEKIDVAEAEPHGVENVVRGRVVEIAYLGDVSIYHLQTDDGFVLRVQETHAARSADPHYNWGDVLYLVWHARDAIVLTA
ncbi:polyamine ABC transporter ATP-binding protein [Silanimonas sp.]|jgi:putrescine transport system ATP-binding protein|uniref:ABC transporter ATP-binding protein n=1 Tax=Silanimonas sp. TaxID=1929290 RepID=UPI0022C3E450|nr:polyamine ABC transporter ATP-binding protein [Silanimonas sp.]MCZ8061435.1 polyamine ABC transporter ATP-binding protein [Silanimonas sp.]